jgi:Lipase (class 3)
MNEWIAAIQSNILGNPVYEVMRKRGRLQTASQQVASASSAGKSSGDSQPPAAASAAGSRNSGQSGGQAGGEVSDAQGPLRVLRGDTVDFVRLLSYARLCEQIVNGRFDELRAHFEALPAHSVSISTVHPDLTAYVITNAQTHQQTVLVHRATWDNRVLATDALITQPSVKRYQVNKLAQQLLGSLRMVRRDYTVVVCGFGLGGVYAAALAQQLLKKNYQVLQCVTFGQPRYVKGMLEWSGGGGGGGGGV